MPRRRWRPETPPSAPGQRTTGTAPGGSVNMRQQDHGRVVRRPHRGRAQAQAAEESRPAHRGHPPARPHDSHKKVGIVRKWLSTWCSHRDSFVCARDLKTKNSSEPVPTTKCLIFLAPPLWKLCPKEECRILHRRICSWAAGSLTSQIPDAVPVSKWERALTKR